jgi:hypothetical protein
VQHTNTSSMSGDSTIQVYFVFLSRSGRAVAHDEERRAFERLGKGLPRKPGRQIWRTGSSRGLSFQGRVGNVAVAFYFILSEVLDGPALRLYRRFRPGSAAAAL